MMEKDDNMNVRVASFSCYLDTAKENLVHRVSAQDPSPIHVLSSAKTITKPPFNTNFSQSKENQDSLKNLRVDSFSYLNTARENFVFKIPGPIQDPTSAFTFSHEITSKDNEISVFGADKYFNMKMEYPKHVQKNKVPRVESIMTKPRIPSSTCSEVSSRNSKTALLPILHRSGSQTTKQKMAHGRRFFAGFGCQGPCFNRKSVHINEIVSHACCGPKLTLTKSQRTDPNIEEQRKSIEVFGSKTTLKGAVGENMERKLSMLTWDAIPKGQNIPTSTIGSTTICDDMASDASSDLFEIEHISGSLYPMLKSELLEDDMSSCMSPQSHYAPSEASIQWSVVTASAADYSVLSDYNDIESSVSVAGDHAIARTNFGSKMRSGGGAKNEAQKVRSGGLLGCKSHKSVDVVAENVCHKNIEKAKHHKAGGV